MKAFHSKPIAVAAAMACQRPVATGQSATEAHHDSSPDGAGSATLFDSITEQLGGPCQRAPGEAAANDGWRGDDAEQEAPDERQLLVSAATSVRKAALRATIGRRLKAARLLQGLAQTEAAAKLGYTGSTQLSLCEQGARQPPLDMIVAASILYGVSLDFLVGLSDEPDRDTALALRAATLQGVRGMLQAASEGVICLFERHAELLGPSATDVAAIVEAGQELHDAAAVVMRGSEFDELRGGARFVRCAHDFERVIQAARARLAAHREMGEQLQAQLKRAMAPAS